MLIIGAGAGVAAPIVVAGAGAGAICVVSGAARLAEPMFEPYVLVVLRRLPVFCVVVSIFELAAPTGALWAYATPMAPTSAAAAIAEVRDLDVFIWNSWFLPGGAMVDRGWLNSSWSCFVSSCIQSKRRSTIGRSAVCCQGRRTKKSSG